MEKIAVLGASRGLGKALVRQIQNESADTALLLGARSEAALAELAREQDKVMALDFAKPESFSPAAELILEFQPRRIFYVAGGGPFGAFAAKQWKDHQWALQLNLMFPAMLLHRLLGQKGISIKQFVAVGSKIAGEGPDPMAASYAAAKHGLHGLIQSVSQENPPFQVLLYAPGYMDTSMLPPNAWPRQKALPIACPEDEARKLWQWSCSSLE